MSQIDILVAEIQRVQEVINTTNSVMKTPPTHLGEQFTRQMQTRGGLYAAKVAPQITKAVQSGRIEEVIIGGAILGTLWVGAYAVDGVAGMISEAKAKKILLSCYDELAVKQNMLISEQQKIVESLMHEEMMQDEELKEAKKRLQILTQQLNCITNVLNERSKK